MNWKFSSIAVVLSTALFTFGCSYDDQVARYCGYGSVSQAQLDGCESHVTSDQVDSYQTNAGRFARGELGQCLADSGPYCKPD